MRHTNKKGIKTMKNQKIIIAKRQMKRDLNHPSFRWSTRAWFALQALFFNDIKSSELNYYYKKGQKQDALNNKYNDIARSAA